MDVGRMCLCYHLCLLSLVCCPLFGLVSEYPTNVVAVVRASLVHTCSKIMKIQ
ncbi:hypothetical protein T439DRAFT_328899 [Meredithblackwellia eburnea MCA 4105]